MIQTDLAASNSLTLDEVIARLSQRKTVEGVLTIGTTSGDKLTPASDYDLVIVLSELPEGLELYGVTYIDNRLTDLLFVTGAQLDEIRALEAPIDSWVWLGRIVAWFEAGHIVFDRDGRLQQIQNQVRAQPALKPLDKVGRAGWWRVNYNLAQTLRLLASDDPVYLIAAELRMALYGPPDLLFNYFDIRNLTWHGDKEAVRYLMAHDPVYLAQFQALISESDPATKAALYKELTARTVAPVGNVWAQGITALAVAQGSDPESQREALNFWDALAGG
ncbi:MAG: hypothetical protein MUQ30_00615 [Anaerolineae bacterium]|nr:hypothetical protein [Anaerolineae bacterium]